MYVLQCLDHMLEGDSLIMICLAKGGLATRSFEKHGEKKTMKMIVCGQEVKMKVIKKTVKSWKRCIHSELSVPHISFSGICNLP